MVSLQTAKHLYVRLSPSGQPAGVLEAKRALQFATAGTFRGGLVTPTQRAVIEEAIVSFMLHIAC